MLRHRSLLLYARQISKLLFSRFLGSPSSRAYGLPPCRGRRIVTGSILPGKRRMYILFDPIIPCSSARVISAVSALSHTVRACSQVDEGIEAMLCCWLQQLQEFGGPEVEKPDLLQLGSVNSLRPYLQASGGNLPRHTFFKDPRARYKVSGRPRVDNNFRSSFA